MKCFLRVFSAAAVLVGGVAQNFAAELPTVIKSAPCTKPPTIDGKLGEGEWKEATPVEFELSFLKIATQSVSKRACQLRVMNSANGLYVALRVPDEAENRSFEPLDCDIALLAFCRGKELTPGDDRKVVVPGAYVDKHTTSPGEDADDLKQDGRGAMAYDVQAKVYIIEWAVPLDSGDTEDIRIKPGSAIRFNLGFLDAFQANHADTQFSSAYPDINQAATWGELRLAADVKDDGGAAFK
ncbi:MAG: hypothetical protein ACT4QC_24280 [Planctomycetaceae bacterium]